MIDPNTVDYSKCSTADLDDDGNIVIVDRQGGNSPLHQCSHIREFLSDASKFYLEAKNQRDSQEQQTENRSATEICGKELRQSAFLRAMEKHLCRA